MPSEDPLFRLLQSADATVGAPSVAGELPHRVRQRNSARAARTRRIAAAALASGTIVFVLVFNRGGSHSTIDQPGTVRTDGEEITRLRAEADALQRQIDLVQSEQALSDLRLEYRRLLGKVGDGVIAESATDRAASIGLCQGDFYRDVHQAVDEARAAYRSVLEHFPESRWAVVAEKRLEQLQMMN
jgi:hypothetical protein